MYGAINDALLTWHGRVRVPHIHTIQDGWKAGQYEYILPDYIPSENLQPQMKASIAYDVYTSYRLSAETWVDIPGWRIEPNADNQRVLRFDVTPYSSEGRLVWWGHNGPVPIGVPTLSATIDGAATSLTILGGADIPDYGWVKIDSEWMQYAGVDYGAPVTLFGMVRGFPNGTNGVGHVLTTPVKWGVAMPKMELYRVLIDQAIVHLHELFLGNAAPKENQLHQEMIGYYSARVDKFWRSWVVNRPVRQRIDIAPYLM
jgi:hypothetical protein